MRGLKQALSQTEWRKTVVFVVLVIAWAVVASLACQYIVAYPLVWLIGDKVNQPFWTLVYYLLDYSLTLAAIFILPKYVARWLRKRKGNQTATKELEEALTVTPTELGVGHLPTFVDIGLAPIAYFVYAMLANALTRIFSNLFAWFDPNQSQNVGFGYFLSAGDRICAMLAIVIIAPIAEELIMRGWLYGKLRSRLKAPAAILLISLIFGLLHGQWNIGISTFVLSVVLCSLREITGTIWSGTLLHVLSNGIAFYLLYIAIV